MRNKIDNELEKQVNVWAKEAVEKYPGTKDQKRYVHKRVFKNEQFVKELAERALGVLINCLVWANRHTKLKKLNDSCVDYEAPNKTKRDIKVIKAVSDMMEDYYCGSKAIGDCTGAEVLEQAYSLQKAGEGYILQASIFFAIARKATGNKLVRNCMKAADIICIINKAQAKRKIG